MVFFEDDVRQFLFGSGAATASDLAARNIHRARDLGIGFYNEARTAHGLPTCSNFECVTSDPQAVAALNEVYGANNVAYLDPFVGGLLETKAPGAKVGPLFAASIEDQFVRIRDGDRFFYLNPGVLSAAELQEIQACTLSQIIARNSDSPTGPLPVSAFTRSNLQAAGTGTTTTTDSWSTAQIVAVVVPSVIAAILVIVVIALLFAVKRKDSPKSDNPALYQTLVDDKTGYY